jgi:CBS domain-containing protein
MQIRDILRAKGTTVITIAPDAPVSRALSLLVEHDIGAVVVTEADRVTGILSERDLLRALAHGITPLASARVQDLMTSPVITATAASRIHDVMDVMTQRRVRHLPIVDGEQLCGIVSIGDVVNALRQHSEMENRQLHAYITGMPG